MAHATSRRQHPNAPLTVEGRRRMVGCVVDRGWTIEATATRFQGRSPSNPGWWGVTIKGLATSSCCAADTTAWSTKANGNSPPGPKDRCSPTQTARYEPETPTHQIHKPRRSRPGFPWITGKDAACRSNAS